MTRHRLDLYLVAVIAAFAGSPFASASAQAACEWDLSGIWNFYQDNGVTLTFRMTQVGNRPTGKVTWARFGQVPDIDATMHGTINGNNFSFTGDWGGVYNGHIGDHGELQGTTSGIGWHEYYGHTAACLPTATTPPSSAATTPSSSAASTPSSSGQPPMTEEEKAKAQQALQQRLAKKLKQQTLPDATVLQDDDVYSEPGGVGKPIGVLRAPNKVSLLEARPDQWCHVQGNAVPTGSGWVWCAPDFLQH